MIIACPACTTRYVVPDTAIGPEGRTVRCAKCRNSWFQEPGETMAAPQSPSRAAILPDPPTTPAPAPDPAREAEAAPVGAAEEPDGQAPPPAPPPPVARADRFSPSTEPASRFDPVPPFRGRRNPLKLWTWAAAIFAVLAIGIVLAVSSWGLPGWVPVARATFAAAQPELQLDFPLDQQERRQLPNGTEYFGASGTITNTGSETRSVPPVLIVLRDGRERIVYSWEVIPPKRSLAPGESISINEAVTDVPRSARVAEIGWKPS